jgi:hypothetical protein
VLNLTSAGIDFELYLVDDQGNEYKGPYGSLGPGSRTTFNFGDSAFAFLPDEKIIIRFPGSPDLEDGNGVPIWVEFQVVSKDLAVVRKDIPNTDLIDLFSPPPGELWTGYDISTDADGLAIANADDIEHTFNFYLNDGNRDFALQSGPISVSANSLNIITVFNDTGCVSHGQTLKVEMLQPRQKASSRILFLGTLSKMSLSRDPNA